MYVYFISMINIPDYDRMRTDGNDEFRDSSSETPEADDSLGFFNYVKTKWNQLFGWRNPGLYDDIKVDTGRTFNINNESWPSPNAVNFRYMDGSTPLTRALKANDIADVQDLLRVPSLDLHYPESLRAGLGCTYKSPGLGCTYNAPTDPPLVVAVKTRNQDLVRLLLDAGADVNSADSSNYTALYHSVDCNGTEMTQLLLQYNPVLVSPKEQNDPIHAACKNGNLDIVKLLVDKGCDIEPNKGEYCVSPLRIALENSSEDICLYLIENGADINNKGNCDMELFLRACCLGLPRVVSLCIERGCDINMTSKDGLTALMLSAKLINHFSHRSILYRMRKSERSRGAILQPEVCSLIRRRIATVKLLCEADCLIETTCELHEHRMTALLLALEGNNLPVVALLLKHGAKWNDMCHKQLLKSYQFMHGISNTQLAALSEMYMPRILQILDHKSRMLYHKMTDQQFSLPNLKDCCRQVIRRQLKKYTETRMADSVSILPLIPSLKLPALITDYLCYNDVHIENIDTINRIENIDTIKRAT